jgi:hypothetical protein
VERTSKLQIDTNRAADVPVLISCRAGTASASRTATASLAKQAVLFHGSIGVRRWARKLLVRRKSFAVGAGGPGLIRPRGTAYVAHG